MALLVAFGISQIGSARAQEPSPTPASTKRGVWQAELPGGKYIVRLSAITAISMHEYVVDNAARVTEVNIGTAGAEYVRFYYIEPNIPAKAPDGIGQSTLNLLQEKAEDASNRVGADDAWKKVVKNYPTTTHAHTIEYRLSSKDALSKLFDSVQHAWLDDHGGTFKP
jgi:hypothetical protein